MLCYCPHSFSKGSLHKAQHITQYEHCYNCIKQDACCVQVCIYVLQLHQILFFVKTLKTFIFYTNTVCAVWWSRLVFCKCLVQILGSMPDILRSIKFSSVPLCKYQYFTWTGPQSHSYQIFYNSSSIQLFNAMYCETLTVSHN